MENEYLVEDIDKALNKYMEEHPGAFQDQAYRMPSAEKFMAARRLSAKLFQFDLEVVDMREYKRKKQAAKLFDAPPGQAKMSEDESDY